MSHLLATVIVLLHFSDYHSHALPFYSEGRMEQGGIARAIGYMERARKEDDAVVLSGGDMINKGSPAWSDKYRCAEWPWLNGVVDAMALGNHDFDYGIDVFNDCRKQLHYPLLSANTDGFEASTVIERKGIRIGVFAVAGNDFASLTKGMTFTDRVAAARKTVEDLRKRADVVVMIGHEYKDDDYQLAREVPGIDVIFGTHGHLKQELTNIPETNTWFISPGQYLTYVSRVTLTLDGKKLARVTGRLVPVDNRIKPDPKIAQQVVAMERDLETDPQYAPLFQPVGKLARPVTLDQLGNKSVELMREATHADVALSTTSSFRQPLPPGTITMEMLRAAMPYDNEIVVATLTREQLDALLAFKGESLCVRPAVLPAKTIYRIATTDYLANVSAYKRFFTTPVEKSGLHAREVVRQWLTTSPAP
ncbi:MAG TPA: metallophosphoesterase [Thermoanaerobaculia bacterium]|jgi:5'-nucleotidase